MRNFLGHDGFIWWIGVVEDIDDPLTLGRCKVRCFGYHPAIKENTVPTEDLPWALAIHPLNTPNLYGTPRLGEWVFGFFLDALTAQEPAILGYIPGIPQDVSEYFGVKPKLTRNFNTVKQKESVVLDVNGTIIEVLKDGNLNIKANTHLTISSNNITISGNAISIFANNNLNISNTINITKTDKLPGNTILIEEDRIRVKHRDPDPRSTDTFFIDEDELIVLKQEIKISSPGNKKETIFIDKENIVILKDNIKIGNPKNEKETIFIDDKDIIVDKQKITLSSDKNDIIVEKDKIALTGTDEVTIDSPTITLTGTDRVTINSPTITLSGADIVTIDSSAITLSGETVTMSGSTTLSISDPGASLTPTYINEKLEAIDAELEAIGAELVSIAAEFADVYDEIDVAKTLPKAPSPPPPPSPPSGNT
jgi:hypothetical protein